MISKKTILKSIGIIMVIAFSVLIHLINVVQKENIERHSIEGGTTMVQEEKSWKDVYLDNGTIDVELARELGAIGRDEYKEKRDVTINKAAGEYAKENYLAIEEAAKEYIKSEIGREVEILKIDAIFPYSALNIGYQTIEEPIAGGHLMYGIQSNAFTNENSFEKLNLYEYRLSFVIRLYILLHKEQLKEINEYIEKEFPEYIEGDSPYSNAYDTELKYLFINSIEGAEGYLDNEKAEKIYNNFLENPNLSQENLESLFMEEEIFASLGIGLYNKEATKIPTIELRDEVFRKMMSSPYKDYFLKNKSLTIYLHTYLIEKNGVSLKSEVKVYNTETGGDYYGKNNR